MKKKLLITYLLLIQFGGLFYTSQVFSASSPSIDCKDTCETILEDSNPELFFKKNLESMKTHYISLKDTIDSVQKGFDPVNLSLPVHSMAKIAFAAANFVNVTNKIAQSKYLKGFNDPSICKLLCKSANFINHFSESLTTEKEGIPIIDVFKEKIDSDWFKNGMSDIDFCIKTLVKCADQDNSQQTISSYLPIIKSNYRELTDTVCRMLKADNELFANEMIDFVQYVKNFTQVLTDLENNDYLTENKEMEKIKPINILVQKLQGYFTNLLSKIDEIQEEIHPNTECSQIQLDAFTQEIMHVIFMYKHHKLDYKQMNNEVNKLIAILKSLQNPQK